MLHVDLFGYFLEKLKATSDGDGSLLDHSTILYAAAISDGNQHSNHNLPLVVAGHAGRRKGGRHFAAKTETPVTNLFVDILNQSGIEIENFGDSTGRLSLG